MKIRIFETILISYLSIYKLLTRGLMSRCILVSDFVSKPAWRNGIGLFPRYTHVLIISNAYFPGWLTRWIGSFRCERRRVERMLATLRWSGYRSYLWCPDARHRTIICWTEQCPADTATASRHINSNNNTPSPPSSAPVRSSGGVTAICMVAVITTPLTWSHAKRRLLKFWCHSKQLRHENTWTRNNAFALRECMRITTSASAFKTKWNVFRILWSRNDFPR